ncbi:hypothetical protein LUZ63_001240 [Rhynchospora breviuscula]|uniref:GTP diphosphokinase n=1 Tax=Rhynchospora breviuscula TaxID=2022672 RepID=A0A9Q0CWM4_9POAL|nr:hypothetical protein LUZ63_001240 [Rhynchospora breviuscula]
MSAPAIALYTGPPGGVSQIPSEPTCAASTSASKTISGGLSMLFSSSPSPCPPTISRHVADDLSRSDDLGCSSYSFSSSFSKSREYHSPVSVFQSPASTSRSPPALWTPHTSRHSRDRTFNSFVRHALGSCLDFAPSSPSYQEEGMVRELGFESDEGSSEIEADCEPYAKEMLAGAQSRHKIFYEEVVVKAFFEAMRAHRGQTRASGVPYLEHCVETAVLLAEIGANTTVVAAGLLHDTTDDSHLLDYEGIFRMFGAGIADLVEGVSKLSHLSKLARDNNTASRTAEADRLHTMFLAMADARAVLIKLSDRLHNMRTLDALPPVKQQRFSKETLEIFVPLANRLGISSWKEQLENICFRFLNPEQHRELSSNLEKSFDEAVILSAIKKLEQGLKDEGVAFCSLSGRHKSLYSIYTKMLKKNLSMDAIHDIHGVRLVVDKEEDCYKALDIVHHLWPQTIGRFKDYIAHPKLNGYQSLHTVVMSEDEHPLEVQIRTKEMHLQAEYGFAAHWSYKEGSCKHPFILQMVQWVRWVVSWQCEVMTDDHASSFGSSRDKARPPCPFPSHSDNCPYSYTRQCQHDGPVFVAMLENDKFSLHEFPSNSTVADLLERVGVARSIWSPYSFPLKEELKPQVNGQPVSDPTLKLNMGDLVELTPKLSHESLHGYREEIKRMYDKGPMLSGRGGWGN